MRIVSSLHHWVYEHYIIITSLDDIRITLSFHQEESETDSEETSSEESETEESSTEEETPPTKPKSKPPTKKVTCHWVVKGLCRCNSLQVLFLWNTYFKICRLPYTTLSYHRRRQLPKRLRRLTNPRFFCLMTVSCLKWWPCTSSLKIMMAVLSLFLRECCW